MSSELHDFFHFSKGKNMARKYPLEEEYVIDYPLIIQVDEVELKRDVAGVWRLQGKASIEVPLSDGRVIWGVRPFKSGPLSQEGRRPYKRSKTLDASAKTE